MYVGQVRPRDRQANGLGTGCQQQPIVSDVGSASDRDLARADIDIRDIGASCKTAVAR